MAWRIIRKNRPAGVDVYIGVLITEFTITLFDSETDLAGYYAAQRSHGRAGQPVAEYLITDDDYNRELKLLDARIAKAKAALGSAPSSSSVKLPTIAAITRALPVTSSTGAQKKAAATTILGLFAAANA